MNAPVQGRAEGEGRAVPVAMVVAVAENGVIGRDGGMPWRLSTDLKRFKSLTMGKPVVMGRKTYGTLGKPLPGRPNIVISRSHGFPRSDVCVARSVDEALAAAERLARRDGASEICVIGGAEIYRAALDRVDRIYLTLVHDSPAGDTILCDIAPEDWEVLREEAVPAGEADSAPTTFRVLERRRGSR